MVTSQGGRYGSGLIRGFRHALLLHLSWRAIEEGVAGVTILMKMKFVASAGFLAILAGVLVFWLRHENRFAADLRNTAANAANGVEICELRNGEARDCVKFNDSAKSSKLSNLVRSLSEANSSAPPGKVPVLTEKILRIPGSAAGQYARCYRLIEFAGFPDEYVNEIEMDSGCLRVTRYRSGYASIPQIQ